MLALVLVACFFLPLAQCTHKSVSTASSPPPKPSQFVAAAQINFKNSDELGLLALFLWPVPALVLTALVRRRGVRIGVHLAELLACAVAMFFAWYIIALWGEIRYGGVIFIATLVFYFAFTTYSLVWQIRRAPRLISKADGA